MANSDSSSALRLTFLTVLVIALFLALFSRLWFLQVLAGDRFAELADTNRLRTVYVDAPRGRMLDREGDELVKNRPSLTISADRQLLLDGAGEPADETAEKVLERLSQLLQLDREAVVERMTSQHYSPLGHIPIAFDVTQEVVYAVRSQQELFPGVIAEVLPVRTYPHGELAAHLVGYLNQISREQLADPAFAEYRGGEQVGRTGLEAVYEADLRGRPGRRTLEVTARNTVIDVVAETEARSGNDLVTSLDLDLQQAVETLLADGIVASRDEIHTASGRNLPSPAGSAVVLDPRDGRVLAMASYPTFDPSEFVGGLSSEYARYLFPDLAAGDEDTHAPMLNRNIQGEYPPGSVFKTVTGAAFMEAGLTGPETTVPCPGSYEVGGITFRNWNNVDEGPMALAQALRRSCDTYFYDLAYRQWQREQSQTEPNEILPEVAERFGFGRRLGIDLPSELTGYVPSRALKQQRWLERRDLWCAQAEESEPGSYRRAVLEDNCVSGGAWRGGDAVNSSIGQGEILTTPLQVAAHYAAIANGGTIHQPLLGMRIVGADGEVVREIVPEVVSELGLDDAELAAIRRGLEEVVMHERGTAYGAFQRGTPFPLDEIPIAGKTGTAELKPKVPYAWFAAYAPANDPQYVVVVNVEEGGGGSQTAAPIARNIFEHIFGIVDAEDNQFDSGDPIYD
ncbi:penicillin-binding protein 2 [Egicoccus sp. AB-alg6-2]|uniref:penicillin-binding protein 2 n=1 Tax=Egicoccus sp. AB-alg6-2 TaxID=3242692 RepID=UPI00359ED4F9